MAGVVVALEMGTVIPACGTIKCSLDFVVNINIIYSYNKQNC